MQQTKTIVDEVRAYVVKKISEELPEEITYHSIGHTIDVVSSAMEIGKQQKLKEEEVEILEIAAWFHDIGYVVGVKNHEECGAKIAKKYLKAAGYPSDRIDKVCGCILATKMPQTPKNNLEQIICDADMLHLAKEDYFAKSDLLYKEIQVTKECEISEENWLEMNRDFLDNHCFFTDYAKEKYDTAVKNNLQKIRVKLKKWKQATK